MKMMIHVIMGYNEVSIGVAKYLLHRNEVVYITDCKVKGVHKQKDFAFVDRAFVDALDTSLFKVYVYEPPYKRARLLSGEND
ncbi:hypothetical protein [Paenisporosarcina sp. TG20]|uniref:hypothetical protein n=1 Tax=Paenisporosarcina sp. TG20 TaxID=1211706 RepID=UPI0002DE8B89|nr:hypothetical protein [Paenisporosarcina sp. TG20]